MTVECACKRKQSFETGNVYKAAFDAGWRLSPTNKPQCPVCSGTGEATMSEKMDAIREALRKAAGRAGGRAGGDPFDPFGAGL